MAYQAFRENGAPTYYDANQTAWKADILEAGLIFAFCILGASFFAILPGIRGKEKLFTFLRVSLSLFIGGVIVVSNFAYTWESSSIHTRTKYKAGTVKEITADVGVHIGLRGINITLKATPEAEQHLNETINYNEHFSWEWAQGRFGFGPFAGRFNQEYRAAQFRGLPLPILWIAEYFTFDGEGIRWGRHYRQAGWFSHILLWLAFPLWVLTNILFLVLLRYGAYFLMMTGTSMIVANIIWATIRNVNELKIPWEDGVMEFSFGGSFYVCLITGIVCVILGIVITFLDLRYPEQLVTFFGADVLQDTDEVAVDEEDENGTGSKVKGDTIPMTTVDDGNVGNNGQGGASPGTPMKPPAADRPPQPIPRVQVQVDSDGDIDDEELYGVKFEPPPPPRPNLYERRKSRGLTTRFQKSRRRRPPPPPPLEQDDDYVNTTEFHEAATSEVRINMR